MAQMGSEPLTTVALNTSVDQNVFTLLMHSLALSYLLMSYTPPMEFELMLVTKIGIEPLTSVPCYKVLINDHNACLYIFYVVKFRSVCGCVNIILSANTVFSRLWKFCYCVKPESPRGNLTYALSSVDGCNSYLINNGKPATSVVESACYLQN